MTLSSLDIFKYNKTEPFFFKFVSPILNVGFLQIACQNKSRPGGEIFCMWTRGNNIFFPVKRENNGKTIFIWTGSKTFCFIIRETMFRITSFYSCAFQPIYVFNRIPQALFRLMTVFWSHWNIRKLMVFWYFQGA